MSHRKFERAPLNVLQWSLSWWETLVVWAKDATA